MKRITYLGVFAASALALALGLLFTCAAIAVPARWPLAIALLGIGTIGAGWCAYSYRKWADAQPAALAAHITDLAASHHGEVTLAQIMSTLNVTASVAQAIAHAAGVNLELDDFTRIGAKVPVLADLRPSGRYSECRN